MTLVPGSPTAKIVAAALREDANISEQVYGSNVWCARARLRADELDPPPEKSKADRIIEDWNRPFGYGPSVTDRLRRVLNDEGIT